MGEAQVQVGIRKAMSGCSANIRNSPQRRAARLSLSIRLVVQPMLSGFVPCGTSVKAITRDVSEYGLGFLSVRPVETDWMSIVEESSPEHYYFCRVVHTGGRLNEETLFLTGVEFASPEDRESALRLLELAKRLGIGEELQ